MPKMPVVFVGHGSPMNVIEENTFTQGWKDMAQSIPRPKAIVCISAHWYGMGEKVSAAAKPETIYDFYGFPPALYQVKYEAPGAPQLAYEILGLLGEGVYLDNERGLDHGAWSVLHSMYPEADIPVCQLSVNARFTPEESYKAGRLLKPLREQEVLILGSGNIVHNLGLVNWEMQGGYAWADEFDLYIKDAIVKGEHDKVLNYSQHPAAEQAFVYRDHYDPLLYVLGATDKEDTAHVLNEERVLGSLSMTSYIIG